MWKIPPDSVSCAVLPPEDTVHRAPKPENFSIDVDLNVNVADSGFRNEFTIGNKLNTFRGSACCLTPFHRVYWNSSTAIIIMAPCWIYGALEFPFSMMVILSLPFEGKKFSIMFLSSCPYRAKAYLRNS